MIDLNAREMLKKQHIIYYEWYLDIRAGGPTGYLANLLDGLNQLPNNDNPFIMFNTSSKPSSMINEGPSGLHAKVQNWFYKNDNRKSFYVNNISRYQKSVHNNYVDFLNNYNHMFCDKTMFSKINLEKTKTIHVHTIGDAVKVRNSLKQFGYDDIKLLLTCHTPEAASNEYYNSTIEQGFNETKALQIKEGWKVIEQKALEYADILIFPSKEAMEPLSLTMEGFNQITKSKDIRYMATGAKMLKATLTKSEAKKKYNVEDKFVIGYVGRHNSIKGYDILKQAAMNILDKNKNLCFLIGGAQGSAFKPLQHERWIEAGWVNPADLFMAIDVFVLPNRMTYYDLVLLEVMSLGVPIIASNTGGNKSVQNLTNSLCLYNNTADDLGSKIMEFHNKSSAEMSLISNHTSIAYQNNFTTLCFAERYKSLINEIYKDYQLY